MRKVLSISLPDPLLRQLKEESKKENATYSELIRKAIQDLLFRKEFAELRKKAMLEAAQKGINLTEEQIFREIS